MFGIRRKARGWATTRKSPRDLLSFMDEFASHSAAGERELRARRLGRGPGRRGDRLSTAAAAL